MQVIWSVFISNHIFFFFFNDTAATETYTLSLHDALPIWPEHPGVVVSGDEQVELASRAHQLRRDRLRSEEHTSELQSLTNLVCRRLLEKKKKNEFQAITKKKDEINGKEK